MKFSDGSTITLKTRKFGEYLKINQKFG